MVSEIKCFLICGAKMIRIASLKQYAFVFLLLVLFPARIIAQDDNDNLKKLEGTLDSMHQTHKEIILIDKSIGRRLKIIRERFSKISNIFANIECAEKKVSLNLIELEIHELTSSESSVIVEKYEDLLIIKKRLNDIYKNDCGGIE